MLELINIMRTGDLISFTILVEGNTDDAYRMTVKDDGDVYPVVSTDLPDECFVYGIQARTALKRYAGREFPEKVTSMWY